MEKYESAKNFYRDEATDADLDGNEEETMRIYQERTDMNLVCLMSGECQLQRTRLPLTGCMQI
mgnify:CR=1 FL=1